MGSRRSLLIIACGALAREIRFVLDANDMADVDLTCLPADLHNDPAQIPIEMRRKIDANEDKYERIVALYADCGTGGRLDEILRKKGVERIAGPHCYAFYAGQYAFNRLHETEIGTFYLTDYLVRFFDRLVIQGLGLDRHPSLRDSYFGNYTRLTYLAQTHDPELQRKAQDAARCLNLEYGYCFTGFAELGEFITQQARKDQADDKRHGRVLA